MAQLRDLSPSHYLLDVTQYHSMLESGILSGDRRYELIKGLIYQLTPVGSKHVYTVKKLEKLLEACFADRATVFTQSPLNCSDNSEPQPDLLIVKPPLERYRERLPKPEDVLLIIEVADSTLAFDRSTKTELYAEMGIPEYWIANLRKRQLEVNRNPDREEKLYRDKMTLSEGQPAKVDDQVCEIIWWE